MSWQTWGKWNPGLSLPKKTCLRLSKLTKKCFIWSNDTTIKLFCTWQRLTFGGNPAPWEPHGDSVARRQEHPEDPHPDRRAWWLEHPENPILTEAWWWVHHIGSYTWPLGCFSNSCLTELIFVCSGIRFEVFQEEVFTHCNHMTLLQHTGQLPFHYFTSELN